VGTPGASMAMVSPLDEADRKTVLDRLGLPSGVPCVLLFAAECGSTVGTLELGGARERVLRACAVEGLGARWVPAEEIADRVPADAPWWPDDHYELVGLLAVGAPAEEG